MDALTGLGLDATLGASTASIVADLDCGDGPTVLLRAEDFSHLLAQRPGGGSVG